jgi:hypothetical protein
MKLIAALLLAAPLVAGPVSTMTFSCFVTGLPPVTNSTGCNITNSALNNATAIAKGEASMTDLTEPTFTMSGHLKLDVFGTAPGNEIPRAPQGLAQADIAISETFYTWGPVRQGFFVFDVLAATGRDAFQFFMGTITMTGGYGNGGSALMLPPFAKIPFQLGVGSSFAITGEGQAGGDELFCCAHGLADVTFHLLEADGVTPVLIQGTPQPVPEPGTLLLASALAWLSRSGQILTALRPAA